MACIPIERLLAQAQGTLPAQEAEQINHHLRRGCPSCQQQFQLIQKTLSVSENQNLISPPDWLLNQAMSLFRWRPALDKASHREIIPATLLSDSTTNMRLLGFRGAGVAGRHLLYRAGNYDVDLFMEFVEPASAFDIVGQTMPTELELDAVAHGDVELFKASDLALATKTNEFGEFLLERVEEGIYSLKLKFKTSEIDIVELRALSEE